MRFMSQMLYVTNVLTGSDAPLTHCHHFIVIFNLSPAIVKSELPYVRPTTAGPIQLGKKLSRTEGFVIYKKALATPHNI
jgi:hypothetical protein